MIFLSRQNSRSIPFGMLLVAYLATCLLAPWFHQHPGENHAELTGDSYHSHVSAFASPAQEFEQDHHGSQEGLHLLEGSQLFDKVQAAIATHFGQIFAPGKFAPQIDFLVSPFVENSPPNSIVKAVLKFPPIQPARDYFALTATGLSPPLA